ncbi:hypothetical protein P168DRAFT_293199 [Aspergillus campestris IBT 28561]|uniref:Uncharacterized protein n=1 Tax=Aspergillus campestris (strain IBT 28561) TaxID=1392248 RepID=A0A2I1CT48_ASPC2|nr:uncharacterized protein P168DRAFT_293199 [Aspergillus campestris IBT 28561]PKY00787.1 hypothetical protein P168DRAFT_293199 [Aspergillus campestris IBT 28561]
MSNQIDTSNAGIRILHKSPRAIQPVQPRGRDRFPSPPFSRLRNPNPTRDIY